MGELQNKLFDLLFILVPFVIFVGIFLFLEKKRQK